MAFSLNGLGRLFKSRMASYMHRIRMWLRRGPKNVANSHYWGPTESETTASGSMEESQSIQEVNLNILPTGHDNIPRRLIAERTDSGVTITTAPSTYRFTKKNQKNVITLVCTSTGPVSSVSVVIDGLEVALSKMPHSEANIPVHDDIVVTTTGVHGTVENVAVEGIVITTRGKPRSLAAAKRQGMRFFQTKKNSRKPFGEEAMSSSTEM